LAAISLFTRLFKYAPRDGREQIENFLTECLGDFLERMTEWDRPSVERFIAEVLFQSKMPVILRDKISRSSILRWETQKLIRCASDHGYVDLCLIADGDMVLVVENKVNAGFTTHRVSEAAGEDGNGSEDEGCSQLAFYERYLRSKGKIAGLVLLTHLTEAPSTFLANRTDQDKTEIVFRHVCRWAETHKWLTRWGLTATSHQTGDPEVSFLTMLAGELAHFLEDQQLSIAELKTDDLNLMQGFFSQKIPRKIRNLLQSVRTSVWAIPGLVTPHNPPRAFFDKDFQIAWDWVYCFEPELKWFISWGISSGDAFAKSYLIEFETPLHAFVLIGSDHHEIPVSRAALHACESLGWKVYEPAGNKELRLVKTIDPDTLLGAGKTFNGSFEAWATQAVNEGVVTLQSAHEQIEKGK
jgi:hypothetical protein